MLIVQKHGLVSFFFKFFTLEHPNNNTHNIKLIRKLVESPELDKRILYEQGINDQIFD